MSPMSPLDSFSLELTDILQSYRPHLEPKEMTQLLRAMAIQLERREILAKINANRCIESYYNRAVINGYGEQCFRQLLQ